MIVQTNVVGSRAGADEHVVEVRAGPMTLRDLLRVLVRHELAEYERRRVENRTLRILTPADLATGAETGAYGRELRATPKAPTLDAAHARAIEAFDDELYFVFLDDERVEELDAELEIAPESTLRLVQLVALAGG
ncbi:hypothetical protein [Agromyces sp. GXS1127]|uniref:hypothetical protein n=1 Tax=Agromyces sp. GXS1127 TaxID=3424181 RepID=UPI003D315447